MKKGFALIAMLMLAVVMLSGCNLIGYDAELDGAQVVASVNGDEITKADWIAYRDYMIAYEQQYMQQYYGFTMPIDDAAIASYGEMALEQMIEGFVIDDKLQELGLDPLDEEKAAEVEEYADSMIDLYKMMIRYQNYPELETVEEEQERLAAEAAEVTPSEPVEAVATVTDAMLDEMLINDLNTIGYTREYFVESETASMQTELLREETYKDVAVTDEQVKAEFDSRVASQQASYDANPAGYANAESYGTETYYTPAGYRGVKNLLIMLTDEKQAEIDELNATLTTAKNANADAAEQLEQLKAEDTSVLDAEALTSYSEQIAALEEQLAASEATIAETETKVAEATEAAFAEILPAAQEALAKAQAGEDFDALIETYGEDTGMVSEPNKSRGYLVCEGLSLYEQAFQDAAMALANVGDVSAEPVKTSYGYHILQYAGDIAQGAVEYTDEIKESIHDEMLAEAQDAAYEAAVTQWVSEAKVETFPKVME